MKGSYWWFEFLTLTSILILIFKIFRKKIIVTLTSTSSEFHSFSIKKKQYFLFHTYISNHITFIFYYDRFFLMGSDFVRRTPPNPDDISTSLEDIANDWGCSFGVISMVPEKWKYREIGSKWENSHFGVKYTSKFYRKCVDASKIWVHHRILRHKIALWDLFDLGFVCNLRIYSCFSIESEPIKKPVYLAQNKAIQKMKKLFQVIVTVIFVFFIGFGFLHPRIFSTEVGAERSWEKGWKLKKGLILQNWSNAIWAW